MYVWGPVSRTSSLAGIAMLESMHEEWNFCSKVNRFCWSLLHVGCGRRGSKAGRKDFFSFSVYFSRFTGFVLHVLCFASYLNFSLESRRWWEVWVRNAAVLFFQQDQISHCPNLHSFCHDSGSWSRIRNIIFSVAKKNALRVQRSFQGTFLE